MKFNNMTKEKSSKTFQQEIGQFKSLVYADSKDVYGSVFNHGNITIIVLKHEYMVLVFKSNLWRVMYWEVFDEVKHYKKVLFKQYRKELYKLLDTYNDIFII